MQPFTIKVVNEGMVRCIHAVCKHHLPVHHGDIFQHILLLRHQLFPGVQSRTTDLCCHDTILRCSVIGVQVDLVTDDIYRRILVIHVGGHLDELGVRNAEVAHIQVITGSRSALIKEHHGLFAVDTHAVELLRKDGILVEQHILALWGSHLMVVELMGLVEEYNDEFFKNKYTLQIS